MRKEAPVTGGYYHIYNRGVDRRITYGDDADRHRFHCGMRRFNSLDTPSVRLSREYVRRPGETMPLVKILSYTLMPNHYHFLLRQEVDHGISSFMQRLGRGYAAYFNIRYGRSGSLWESEYRATEITSDAQLLHTSRYIHLNPLKLFFPDWKTRGVKSWTEANNALKRYRWSSYPHLLRMKDDPAVDIDILLELFDGPDDYEGFMKEWVTHGRN